jgi:signal peptidase I
MLRMRLDPRGVVRVPAIAHPGAPRADAELSGARPAQLVKKKALLRTAWALAIVLLLLWIARLFVGDVYLVSSGSMEPTIQGLEGGGEWVFVRYDREPPERNELAVLLPASGGEPHVKRVIGLPHDSVRIEYGDVKIDDRILRRDANADRPRPLVTVFDERWMPLEGSFRMGTAGRNPWTRVDGAWRIDANSIASGRDEGLMYYSPKLTDDYLTPDHALVSGTTEVNDAVLECEVWCETARGRVRLQLVERGDVFEITLAPAGGNSAVALLTRRNFAKDVVKLHHTLLPDFAPRTWHRVRFSNVDDELALEVDGKPTSVREAYDQNEPHPSEIGRPTRTGLHVGPRVLLGAEGGAFRFRGVRIERDLFYTPRGTHGTGTEPEQLGPDEYFVLGDNSAHSMDSRERGPVPRERIVGRAVAVVWPPSRWRRLEPRASPKAP